MKRNNINFKNTEKTMIFFRKIVLHMVLLCLMIMAESLFISKTKILPENIFRITQLIFFATTVIPAMILRSQNGFYETVGYYLGLFLIWLTIGAGVFDCTMQSMKQLDFCILISLATVAMVEMFLRKTTKKYKRR